MCLELSCKGGQLCNLKCYIIKDISYIIHTFSSVLRLLCLSDLKNEGVSPVIFLN